MKKIRANTEDMHKMSRQERRQYISTRATLPSSFNTYSPLLPLSPISEAEQRAVSRQRKTRKEETTNYLCRYFNHGYFHIVPLFKALIKLTNRQKLTCESMSD